MKLHSLAAVLLLAGCGPSQAVHDAEQAEAEVNLLIASRTSAGQVCAAQRRVADAWLKALDKEKYERADAIANITCVRSEQLGAATPYDQL